MVALQIKKLLFLLAFTLLIVTVLVCMDPHGAVLAENVTNEEFLQTYFQLCLHDHGPGSFNIVQFLPSAGVADENAVLFIIRVHDDEGLPAKTEGFRSIIRMSASTLLLGFQSCFIRLPTLRKRWPLNKPETNLIIRHVRLSNDRDTLAVTIDGVTSFNPADFKRAAERIKKLGGVWQGDTRLFREKGAEGMEPPIPPQKNRDFWDWLQITGPFFVGLVALFIGLKDQILNFLRRPSLDMLFDQHKEGYYHELLHNPLEEIHDPVTNTRYVIRQPGFNSRIEIWNRGKTTARKAQARLVDLAIYDNKKNLVKRIVYHPSIIKWSGEKEFHPVDIPGESKFFLDLFYAVSETKEDILRYHRELGESTLRRVIGDAEYSGDVFWNVWIDTSYPRGVPPKYTIEGHFELNFFVYAENCRPRKFAVSVDWDKQKWNRPDIKRIEA
ncbi:MAG: hypothetical protein FJ123_06145 [Deltaproteobacteria bacterium]|nr:hypothetical protein [Deltaproteobacteria bacterium]